MNINKKKRYEDPVLDSQISEICRLSKKLSGAGSPSGVVVPRYLGDEYLDTALGDWYKSYGAANTEWKKIT